MEEVDCDWIGCAVSARRFSIAILLTAGSVLFYAPLNYAYVAWKNEKKAGRLSFEDNRRPIYTDSPEQAPLLQERK